MMRELFFNREDLSGKSLRNSAVDLPGEDQKRIPDACFRDTLTK